MQTVRFNTYPYAMQSGMIIAPDNIQIDATYIREHWNEVYLDEADLDYRGTDIDDIRKVGNNE